MPCLYTTFLDADDTSATLRPDKYDKTVEDRELPLEAGPDPDRYDHGDADDENGRLEVLAQQRDVIQALRGLAGFARWHERRETTIS